MESSEFKMQYISTVAHWYYSSFIHDREKYLLSKKKKEKNASLYPMFAMHSMSLL